VLIARQSLRWHGYPKRPTWRMEHPEHVGVLSIYCNCGNGIGVHTKGPWIRDNIVKCDVCCNELYLVDL
jgi:hypothetical protein